MSEATDAILDIIDGQNEFGSSIKITSEVETGYDPYTGATYATTFADTKAFIKTEATPKVYDSFVNESTNSAYDMSIKLYFDTTITKDNKVVFKGNSYEIVFISETILQDTTILYELLVRK